MNTGPVVYKITNKINGKAYIGCACANTFNRWSFHWAQSAKNSKGLLHRAIAKYGLQNFIFEVIYVAETIEESRVEEIKSIVTHKSHVSEGGYNLTFGGDGWQAGMKHTEDTKHKISKTRKRKFKEGELKGIGRKLSEDNVKEIKKSRVSLRKLAKQFGVDHKVIWKIKHGKLYQEVKE